MFDRIKQALGFETKSTLAHPSPDLLALFGLHSSATGLSVTPDTALRSPTTLAACRAIIEAIGSLPFHLFRRDEGGARERDNDHAAASLLAGDWAPWAGSVETRTAMQLDALLYGAAFALVVRAGDQPRELHRIDPRNVSVDTTSSEPRFKVRSGNSERIYGWRDILHVSTPGSAMGRSICLMNLARDVIALDIIMAEHQAKLFSNGARPSGVFEYSKLLSPELAKRLKESFSSAHTGGSNSGKTLFLEDGMKFTPLQFNSVDLQFLELRRFVIQEIGRAFKVPGTLIGDLERATWKNVEELMRQFVQTCLMPWAEVWQASLERVLLSPEERGKYFIEAIFDDLIRSDLTARFTAYRQAAGGSWLTPNEIRALDNRPPVAGGDELIRQAGQADAAQPTGGAADGA